MKIQAKDTPLFNVLYSKWYHMVGEPFYDTFDVYLKTMHNIEITLDHPNSGWSTEYLIFNSEQDYFLALMKLS